MRLPRAIRIALAALLAAAIPATASAELVIPPPPMSVGVNGPEATPRWPSGAVQVPVAAGPTRIVYPEVDAIYQPQIVAYTGDESAGTIIVDTVNRFLYLVMTGGTARRYGVGVGKPGFEWSGVHAVTRKAEWPDWRPPAEMRERNPSLPAHVPGGPANPLGARALYLGSTLYRIHGSNEPWTIGQAVSSGCIRMRNQDVIELYDLTPVGARVVVY